MPLTENLAAFFADFGVIVTRVDPAGSAVVIFDRVIEGVDFGGYGATGANYSMTYQRDDLPGLSVGEGLIIGGQQYRVRDAEVSADDSLVVGLLGIY